MGVAWARVGARGGALDEGLRDFGRPSGARRFVLDWIPAFHAGLFSISPSGRSAV